MRFPMTTISLLALASGVFLTATPKLAHAQAGTVLSHQKISDTEGNFGGVLDKWDALGISVTSLGDLDGDGIVDLAVGTRGDDDGSEGSCDNILECNRGAVWILFLDTDGTVKSEQKISSTQGNFGGNLDDGDHFGWSVASLGDLNGDGIPDLAVGARSDDDGSLGHCGNVFECNRGAVWILFLNTDGTVKSEQKISNTQGDFGGALDDGDAFGVSVAALGDLDGDGTGDIAVGATGDDDGGMTRGAVWILFLNSNGTVKSEQKISATTGGFDGDLGDSLQFGWSVTSLGDLDGDGTGDLAVGVFRDSDGGPFRGGVWVLFLNIDGTVKSEQKISDTQGGFSGTLNDFDHFGHSLASLGDLDGDGVADLAVGAGFDDSGGGNRGAVWVLFLNSNGTVKAHQKISDTQGGFAGVVDDADYFGTSVGFLGDLDGDGIGDLAVGAPNDDDGGLNHGAVWVLFLDGILTDCDEDIDENGQVTLCHMPRGNPQTITVNANAVAGHLAHGDTCGPCRTFPSCNPVDPPDAPEGQTVWYVDDDTCPESGSGSLEDPFCKIQDGIDTSDHGDMVLVAPGTYGEHIYFLGKSITVQSYEPTNPEVVECTIIDGSLEGKIYSSVVTFSESEDDGAILQGFTITHGIAGSSGGGIRCMSGSNPTITHCVISNNWSEEGGGIGIFESSPTISHCTITQNFAFQGGGISARSNSNPVIRNCSISDNAGYRGGGISTLGNTTVTDCVISGNTANDGSGAGIYSGIGSALAVSNCLFEDNVAQLGGGIHADRAASMILTNCTFRQNTATLVNGGGVAVDLTDLVMTNCVFEENTAVTYPLGSTQQGETLSSGHRLGRSDSTRQASSVTLGYGGGLSVVQSQASVTNCLFVGNTGRRGGAVSFSSASSLCLAGSTFSGNHADVTGGGLYLSESSSATVENCIFRNDTAPEGAEILSYGGPDTLAVSYCNIEGGQEGIGGNALTWGDGNIDFDPLFVDPFGNDYRLLSGSPSIDAADNTAVPADIVTDLDGNPRFADDPNTPDTGNPDGINPIVDMGAYEFQDPCADNDGDGQVTICHQPNSGNPQTMSVNQNNLPAHLAHGDHCGPCEK